MKTIDYKKASETLSKTAEAIRFVNKGLHGKETCMYPVSVIDRVNIAVDYIDGKI